MVIISFVQQWQFLISTFFYFLLSHLFVILSWFKLLVFPLSMIRNLLHWLQYPFLPEWLVHSRTHLQIQRQRKLLFQGILSLHISQVSQPLIHLCTQNILLRWIFHPLLSLLHLKFLFQLLICSVSRFPTCWPSKAFFRNQLWELDSQGNHEVLSSF